jgi:hypothetical protein
MYLILIANKTNKQTNKKRSHKTRGVGQAALPGEGGGGFTGQEAGCAPEAVWTTGRGGFTGQEAGCAPEAVWTT